MNPLAGLVLRRDQAGERHLRLTLLDPGHGLTLVYYRPVAKSGAAMVTPDIFDDAEVFLDPPKDAAAARFVREYRLIRRRPGLARDYTRLALAARLASLITDNPHPPESLPALLLLARDALDALESKPHPETTRLKILWRLARDEGWPVREHFEPGLPAGLAAALPRLIRTPLAELEAEADATARPLAERLEAWLIREAHYVIRA